MVVAVPYPVYTLGRDAEFTTPRQKNKEQKNKFKGFKGHFFTFKGHFQRTHL